MIVAFCAQCGLREGRKSKVGEGEEGRTTLTLGEK